MTQDSSTEFDSDQHFLDTPDSAGARYRIRVGNRTATI